MLIRKIRDEVSPSIRNIMSSLKQGRSQLLQAAGREFQRQTKVNFGNGGTYRPKSWKPLSNGGPATLVRTGKLKNSIQLGQPRGNYIEIFTRDVRAAALFFGYKPRHLPARNPFPMEYVGSPTYNRLTFKSEKEMFRIITMKLTMLSRGALPNQGALTKRATLSYGNPLLSTT